MGGGSVQVLGLRVAGGFVKRKSAPECSSFADMDLTGVS